MTNVLLTSAGRRNYLVDYFRTALNGDGFVFAADANPYAAALQVADRAFVVPPVHAADYIESLLTVCMVNEVRLLVPLNDLELTVIAAARDRFQNNGVVAVVSSPNIVQVCQDKLETRNFLEQTRIRTPRTWSSPEQAVLAVSSGSIKFPLVVKPRFGSGSFGIEVVYSEDELHCVWKSLAIKVGRSPFGMLGQSQLIIQERIDGQEYGLDVINDFSGNYVTTIVKKKLGMRCGETDRAVVVEDASLRNLGRVIGHRLRHIGNLDCDVFLDSDGPVLLEMNPRFGGGYPFTHLAGVDLPTAYLAWSENRNPESHILEPRYGTTATKFDSLVMTSTECLLNI